MIRERMGEYYEAVLDYTAAMPILKQKGAPTFECVFNRGYCYRYERTPRARPRLPPLYPGPAPALTNPEKQ
jgi:hypothetical protein